MHEDGDQYSMLKPVCKRCWRVDDVEALPYILDRAFRLAESGRPGPVLVDIPMDMFSREMEENLWARTYRDSHAPVKPALDPAAVKAIAKKLVEAERPVLHAGGGILLAQASEELASLAEFLDIPVSRTLAGQGCLSDRHPLMIGQTGFWGLEFTHSFTVNADVILGLGTRFGEADSSSWYQGVTFDPDRTTFLQIDIDPAEIGRNYPVEIGAVGDLKIGLTQLLDEVKKICPQGKQRPGLREKILQAKADFKKSNEAISSDSRFPMTPQRILKDVKEVIPEDALIFTDVGWNKNGVAQQFDITVPGSIHHTSGLANMGFGASAVLGGKLAAPDRICITLTGDGGFGVQPSCLATAAQDGIAVTWVVMNNSAFGTIAGLENANYHHKFGTVFQTPDGASYTPNWADVAKAYGIESIRCSSAEEFKPAMEKAMEANRAGRPFLVEAPMENIVVPTAAPSWWRPPWRTSWCPPPAAGTSTTSTPPTSWSRRASWSRRRTASMSPPATPSPTTPSNPNSAAKAANPGPRVRRFFAASPPPAPSSGPGAGPFAPVFSGAGPHPPNFLLWKPSILMVPYSQMR